jgi:hypothetical protein
MAATNRNRRDFGSLGCSCGFLGRARTGGLRTRACKSAKNDQGRYEFVNNALHSRNILRQPRSIGEESEIRALVEEVYRGPYVVVIGKRVIKTKIAPDPFSMFSTSLRVAGCADRLRETLKVTSGVTYQFDCNRLGAMRISSLNVTT